jgi:methylation protein EvaC
MNEMIRYRDTCRGCKSKRLYEFLDLGNMPMAGGFLSEKDIKKEIKVPLRVNFCQDCGLVQILDIPNPNFLFSNYCYVSSVIGGLSEHFRRYSFFLKEKYLKKTKKILEFGCNDGVLLQYFKEDKSIDAFGIDVSENVTKIARERGFDVMTGFFNKENAKKLLEKKGKVDVVTGSNVFAHADDIHEIIDAAKIILDDNGVFIVEVHYLKDLMDTFQYDSIYHEHLCYYSVFSLNNIFDIAGMKIIDAIHLEMHGGGIRVVACKKDSKKEIMPSVEKFINEEKMAGLDSKKRFSDFADKCKEHRKALICILDSVKKEEKSIVGYGAPGRGTILLNYCGIGKDYLDYIVDASPLRSGKIMPGVHIPIIPQKDFMKNKPDYSLIIAWTYKDEIIKREQEFLNGGGKFILPFPKIEIIPQDAPL